MPSNRDAGAQLSGHATEASEGGSSVQSGVGGAGGGSLPAQMPGRSYYKYRSPSHTVRDSAITPMSLIQSHFDIREGLSIRTHTIFGRSLTISYLNSGSARLASFGLSEDINSAQDSHDEAVDASAEEGLLLVHRPKSTLSLDEPFFRPSSGTTTASDPITPSALSVLLQKHEERPSSPTSPAATRRSSDFEHEQTLSSTSNTIGQLTPPSYSPSKSASQKREINASRISPYETQKAQDHLVAPIMSSPPGGPSERSPLLQKSRQSSISKHSTHSSASGRPLYPSQDKHEAQHNKSTSWLNMIKLAKHNTLSLVQKSADATRVLRKRSCYDIVFSCIVEPAKTLPAVILGILMNLLDGVSYGMVSRYRQ